MATYDGIQIPKIYEAQMPSTGGSGWDIAERLIPTLFSTYIRGMQNEEINQLRADTTMYSSIASSAQNYLEPEPIENLIEQLTLERDMKIESGDSVRANYLNANIAAMQPWLMTREKQKDARSLINSMEKEMDSLENTPGYEGKALNTLNDMLENLNEYEPYFNTRMNKDIASQQKELNDRLSVMSILKDMDDNNMLLDDEGKGKDVPGIQITRAKYPNEESYLKAKQAVDLLQIAVQGNQVDSKLLTRGLALHNQSLNEFGVASSEEKRRKTDLHYASIGNLDRQLMALESKYVTPRGEKPDFYLDDTIIQSGLIPDLRKQLNITGTGVDARTLKLIRNYALGNVAKVLENTSGVPDEIEERITRWVKAGKPMGPQGDLLMDDIEEYLGYYKPTSTIKRESVLNDFNFPGTGGKELNAEAFVLGYLDFLKSLDSTSNDLYDLWGWGREQKTSSMGNRKHGASIAGFRNP